MVALKKKNTLHKKGKEVENHFNLIEVQRLLWFTLKLTGVLAAFFNICVCVFT